MITGARNRKKPILIILCWGFSLPINRGLLNLLRTENPAHVSQRIQIYTTQSQKNNDREIVSTEPKKVEIELIDLKCNK